MFVLHSFFEIRNVFFSLNDREAGRSRNVCFHVYLTTYQLLYAEDTDGYIQLE